MIYAPSRPRRIRYRGRDVSVRRIEIVYVRFNRLLHLRRYNTRERTSGYAFTVKRCCNRARDTSEECPDFASKFAREIMRRGARSRASFPLLSTFARDGGTGLRVRGNSANACGLCQKTTYAHASTGDPLT